VHTLRSGARGDVTWGLKGSPRRLGGLFSDCGGPQQPPSQCRRTACRRCAGVVRTHGLRLRAMWTRTSARAAEQRSPPLHRPVRPARSGAPLRVRVPAAGSSRLRSRLAYHHEHTPQRDARGGADEAATRRSSSPPSASRLRSEGEECTAQMERGLIAQSIAIAASRSNGSHVSGEASAAHLKCPRTSVRRLAACSSSCLRRPPAQAACAGSSAWVRVCMVG
jgi:hypothetical protein